MKRNTQKLLALMLAVMMVLLTIPFAGMAATPTYTDGQKLLEMTSLNANAVTSAVAGVNVTEITSGGAAAKDAANPTGIYATSSSPDNGGIGVDTGLPLDENSEYTIRFSVKRSAAVNFYFGFGNSTTDAFNDVGAFLIRNNGDLLSTLSKNNVDGYHKFTDGVTSTNAGGYSITNNAWTTGQDADGYVTFLMTLDRSILTLYQGTTQIGAYNLNSISSNKTSHFKAISTFGTLKLNAGYGGASSIASTTLIVDVKDIAVYQGASVNPGVYSTGDKLLEMTSLNDDAITSSATGVTVAELTDGLAATRGEAATGIYRKNMDKNLGGIGISTGLPLNDMSKYTIRYSVRINDGANFFFGFGNKTEDASSGAQVLFMSSGTEIRTLSNNEIDGYHKVRVDGITNTNDSGPYSNLANMRPTADRYTTFIMTLDRCVLSVYHETTLLGAWNLGSSKNTTKFPQIKTFGSLMLSAGIGGLADGVTVGTQVADVKDIAVYYGVVDPATVLDPTAPEEFDVTFEKADGTEIEKKNSENGTLSLTTFPTVTVTAGKIGYWTNKATGSIVEVSTAAPVTCTEATTFVFNEVDATSNKIIGVQKSNKADGNTVKLRFIGGTWALDGSVIGIEVRTTYVKDNAIQTVDNRLESTTVYRGINATVDGELKNYTARDLGAYYLFAIEMEQVPTTGHINFEVRSYKTVNGEKVVSEITRFSFINGEFVAFQTLTV